MIAAHLSAQHGSVGVVQAQVLLAAVWRFLMAAQARLVGVASTPLNKAVPAQSLAPAGLKP